jgi:hypothetical protein
MRRYILYSRQLERLALSDPAMSVGDALKGSTMKKLFAVLAVVSLACMGCKGKLNNAGATVADSTKAAVVKVDTAKTVDTAKAVVDITKKAEEKK